MAASQACMYSFKSAESAVVRLPRVGRKTGLVLCPKWSLSMFLDWNSLRQVAQVYILPDEVTNLKGKKG